MPDDRKKIPRLLRRLAPRLLRLAKWADRIVQVNRFEGHVMALGGSTDECLRDVEARAKLLVAKGVDPDIAIKRAMAEVLDELREGVR